MRNNPQLVKVDLTIILINGDRKEWEQRAREV